MRVSVPPKHPIRRSMAPQARVATLSSTGTSAFEGWCQRFLLAALFSLPSALFFPALFRWFSYPMLGLLVSGVLMVRYHFLRERGAGWFLGLGASWFLNALLWPAAVAVDLLQAWLAHEADEK